MPVKKLCPVSAGQLPDCAGPGDSLPGQPTRALQSPCSTSRSLKI